MTVSSPMSRGLWASADAGQSMGGRHLWRIGKVWAALGLVLLVLAGAASSVRAGSAPSGPIAAPAVSLDTDAALPLSRIGEPIPGSSAVLPVLLLLLLPVRRAAGRQARCPSQPGWLLRVASAGRSPPVAGAHPS